MKNYKRSLIVTAAIAGLLGGAAISPLRAAEKEKEKTKETKPGKEATGKKVPKVHDCSGQNECKGLGGCKTSDHGCKGKNDCKGKGGCHVTKDDVKNWDKITKKAAAK